MKSLLERKVIEWANERGLIKQENATKQFIKLTEFKTIKGFENEYKINSKGDLISLDRVIVRKNNITQTIKSRIINKAKNAGGYIYYDLYKNGKRKRYLAHVLVYKTFRDDYDSKLDINHIDCDKTNNDINNLELTTRSENMIHALNNGLLRKTIESASNVKLNYNGDIISAKELSKKLNLSYSMILQRHKKGYSVDEIINIPKRHNRNKYNKIKDRKGKLVDGTFIKE